MFENLIHGFYKVIYTETQKSNKYIYFYRHLNFKSQNEIE